MLLKMFCSFGRAVYGHVITKFSGMGRFTYPWYSSGARENCFCLPIIFAIWKVLGCFEWKLTISQEPKYHVTWPFSKIICQIPCLRLNHSSQMHKNFPILGLHMVAFDLSFTYVLVSSKGNNQHLLLKCDNISKHFSPVKHCSLFKT